MKTYGGVATADPYCKYPGIQWREGKPISWIRVRVGHEGNLWRRECVWRRFTIQSHFLISWIDVTLATGAPFRLSLVLYFSHYCGLEFKKNFIRMMFYLFLQSPFRAKQIYSLTRDSGFYGRLIPRSDGIVVVSAMVLTACAVNV